MNGQCRGAKGRQRKANRQYNWHLEFHPRGCVACPFFMPDKRFDSDWPFPQRLPLGAAWSGACAAPGHEGTRPSPEELKSACNIGYAKSCHRLPAERYADAVRFALSTPTQAKAAGVGNAGGQERDGIVRVLFACERAYLPVSHGELVYDKTNGVWLQRHENACLQRMAECYLQAQMRRRTG